MVTKNYIKKVVPLNEESSADCRAKRLRRLRSLANLSRIEICSEGTLNVNTYKGWELGRYGGLPKDGAKKVIDRVASQGVFCTEEWLLHGIGSAPVVTINFDANVANNDSDDVHIQNELNLFKSHHHNAIDFIVNDDGMLPNYQIGDVVVGIPQSGENFDAIINKDCIIYLKDGSQLFRNLRASSISGKFTCVCMNPSTTVTNPILYDVEIISVAPISWHRKKINNQDQSQ